MLNAIWAGMIVLGILYGAFTGNLEAVSNAALESAGEAVDLCITMCGIMGLWTGLMKIAQQAGLIAALTRGISPFVSPDSEKSSGAGVNFHQYCCKRPRTWLGGNSGGLKGDGGSCTAGRKTETDGVSEKRSKRYGEQ